MENGGKRPGRRRFSARASLPLDDRVHVLTVSNPCTPRWEISSDAEIEQERCDTRLAIESPPVPPASLGNGAGDARRRRIVVQYDAYNALGIDFETWLPYRFAYADEPGSQIDALWWDIGPLGLAPYPAVPDNPQLKPWRKAGIDCAGRLVEETRKRGLEVFWSHRVSEVDLNRDGHGAAWKGPPHPFKRQHPDWGLKTWWPHGLWNYAVPEVRRFNVDVLRQLAQAYDLDGFQLDFARHVPCVPPPRRAQGVSGGSCRVRKTHHNRVMVRFTHPTEVTRPLREDLVQTRRRPAEPLAVLVEGRHEPGLELDVVVQGDVGQTVREKRVGEPFEHVAGELLRLLRAAFQRGDDLVEQERFEPRAHAIVCHGPADRLQP